MNGTPDIVARVRFFGTREGGRKGATPPDIYRCPLEFDGEKFDCGLHLNNPVAPGEAVTVSITFLFPELIKPRLQVGSRFTLWEMRTIAEGVVEKVL
jgi:hypothetical protein